MRRLIAIIFFVTCFPTIVLVGTAIYLGQGFKTRASDQYDATRSVGKVVGVANPDGSQDENADQKDWQSLFDGQSLEQWEGNEKVFRIQEKSIVAGSLLKKISNNEFLCTRKKYGNFELKLRAKLIGDGRNAGIQFRSKRIPDHHEVIGYQCDMGIMGSRSIWGSLYDESRRRKFLAEGDAEKTNAATKVDQWNRLVIRCEGTRIQIWVNDYQTVDYTETDEGIEKSGIIGLQIHGGKPAEAWYKDLQIRSLE